MIEPAMGLIPRIIYHFFHPEPNGMSFDVKWYKKPKNIHIFKILILRHKDYLGGLFTEKN